MAKEDGVVDVANGDVVEIKELLLAGKTNLSVKDSSNSPWTALQVNKVPFSGTSSDVKRRSSWDMLILFTP